MTNILLIAGRYQLGNNAGKTNEGNMRKIAFAIAAAALLLFAGSSVWKADATTGAGTLGLARAAKNYSPIDTVACRFDAFCRPGYTMVCRLFNCWCARCSRLYR